MRVVYTSFLRGLVKIEIDNVTATAFDATEEELDWLHSYLSFEDQASKFIRRADGSVKFNNDARRLSLLQADNTFPTGLVGPVKRAALRTGNLINVLDKRIRPCEPMTWDEAGYPSPWLHDFQLSAIDTAIARTRGILDMPTGCHARGQRVLMYDGSTSAVEDVCPGDLLLGHDGPRRVLGLCRGVQRMARVIPTKGEPWEVNLDHVLTLVRTNDGRGKHGALVDVTVRDWLTWSKTKKHLHKLMRAPGVDFSAHEECGVLDPYFVGVLLGDGCLSESVCVANADTEIHQMLEQQAAQWDCKLTQDETREGFCPIYRFSTKAGSPNALLRWCRAYGLMGKTAGTKAVPAQYLRSSREQRLQVLAGLLDTDGSAANGGYDFISKSEVLSRDVVFLARSLGLAAYITSCVKYCQTGAGGVYWRVSISGHCNTIPCRVLRKKALPRSQKKDPLRTGFTIELLPEAEYFGFTVDGDHRYLLDDFTITHNSGKTEVSIGLALRLGQTNTLFVAPEADLMHNAARRWEKRTNITAGRIGDQWMNPADGFTSATFQTLALRLSKKDPTLLKYLPTVGAVIFDECFPADTLVDGTPIQDIRVGDIVTSYDERLGTVVRRRVKNTFKRKPSEMVRVHFDDGSKLSSTPGHPFLTERGWQPAYSLCGQRVLEFASVKQNKVHPMQTVRFAVGTHNDAGEPNGLLPRVSRSSAGRSQTRSGSGVLNVRYSDHPDGATRPGPREATAHVLLQELPSGGTIQELEAGGNRTGAHQLNTYERAQPNEVRRDARKSQSSTSGRGSSPTVERRQRPRPDYTSAQTWGSTSDPRSDPEVRTHRTSHAQVQAPKRRPHRYCGPRRYDSNRGRRGATRHPQTTGRRQTQGNVIAGRRVVRVEILERGGDERFGGVCPDGYVYNFAVEGTETYIVDGIVVHNCHTLPADVFYRTALAIPAYWRIGISGTPLARGDRKSLFSIAATGPIVFKVGTQDLIQRGFISRPHIKMTRCEQANAAASWQLGERANIVESRKRNALVTRLATLAQKPGLVFVKLKKHGQILEKLLTEAGLRVEFIWGEKNTAQRDAAIKRLETGALDLLICSVIFQTGTDIPAVRSMVIACGGKSEIATLQRIGRGMRIVRCPETNEVLKDEFFVYDILDIEPKGRVGDTGNRWNAEHSTQRCKAYTAVGHEVVIEGSGI